MMKSHSTGTSNGCFFVANNAFKIECLKSRKNLKNFFSIMHAKRLLFFLINGNITPGELHYQYVNPTLDLRVFLLWNNQDCRLAVKQSRHIFFGKLSYHHLTLKTFGFLLRHIFF